jgi:2-polyprenyl-3-methyl-5-hydroxy-6-metoxy-1,4-benzoquinol methylase
LILANWVRDLAPGTRILEVGPGAAHVARLAGRQDLIWIGLEHSLDCLPALAHALTGGAIVDVESLSRLPRGYDVVLAADLLEHLTEPQRMLRQVREALPPGGLLLISVPNVAHLSVRLALLFGSFTYAERGILDRTHRIFFTRSSLRALLRQEGFRIEREAVSVVPVPLALPRLPAWMVRLLNRLLEPLTRMIPTLMGYQLLAAARR